MKKILLALALTSLALVSCKETDPDYAAGIEGKYTVQSYTINGVAGTVTGEEYIELTKSSESKVTYHQHLAGGDTTYNDVTVTSYSNAFHLKYTDDSDTLAADESYKKLTVTVKNGVPANKITLTAIR